MELIVNWWRLDYNKNLKGNEIDEVINEVLQDELPMNSIDVENTFKIYIDY